MEPYRICRACIKSEDEVLASDPEDETKEKDDSDEKMVKIAAKMDSRLDYRIKFLELDTRGSLNDSLRQTVLEKVRNTMKWKERHRTSQALKDKVIDLDKFMENQFRRHAGKTAESE